MLKIEFETGNDAFADGNGRRQTAAILHNIAAQIAIEVKDSGLVRDSNGNRIGAWSLSVAAPQESGE